MGWHLLGQAAHTQQPYPAYFSSTGSARPAGGMTVQPSRAPDMLWAADPQVALTWSWHLAFLPQWPGSSPDLCSGSGLLQSDTMETRRGTTFETRTKPGPVIPHHGPSVLVPQLF